MSAGPSVGPSFVVALCLRGGICLQPKTLAQKSEREWLASIHWPDRLTKTCICLSVGQSVGRSVGLAARGRQWAAKQFAASNYMANYMVATLFEVKHTVAHIMAPKRFSPAHRLALHILTGRPDGRP